MCDTKISSPPARPDTSSSYLRKIKKPLIERKRRERINNCLDQLKHILLDNIKQHGGTQVSKLDKADILEMTVTHLRQIHHQQLSVAMATSATAVQQYREGYVECATEAVRYMKSSRSYPTDMVHRVRNHFTNTSYGPGLPTTHGNYRGVPNETKSQTSPIRIKTEESPRSYEAVSPVGHVTTNFSPLLMPVPHVKLEACSPNTSGTCFDMSACSTGNNTSADSGLSMTPRDTDAVSDDESASQKNVWRPF